MKPIFFIILLYFISISSFNYSQNKVEKFSNGFSIDVTFDEQIYTDKSSGNFKIRDYVDFTDVSQSGKFKLPSKTFLIAIPPYSKPDIKIVNQKEEIIKGVIPSLQPRVKLLDDSSLIFEDVDFSEAVSEDRIQNSVQIIGYGWYREFYCVQVKINTHSFDVNLSQLKIIKSAKIILEFGNDYPIIIDENSSVISVSQKKLKDVILNSDIAVQFNGKQALVLQDTTGNWINYDAKYLKIGTANDGLFRITKSDLEANGINVSSINPKTFRLIESGIEVPISVVGQDDNAFDDADYIQFYGALNYSKISHRVINSATQPYNEYLNRYSDTTFYFLTWGVQDGIRIKSQNSFAAGLTDSLNYYNYLEHTEDSRVYFSANVDEINNQMPGWLKNKTWYYHQTLWLYNNTTRNYNFNVIDAVPNKSAKFFYKAVSGGSNIISNAHQVILKVNNTLLDSQSINRNDQLLLSGTLNTNQFKANPNVLSVKNYANGTNPNFLGVDWYDIEYPRLLKLNNDFLIFNVSDDVTPGLKVVKIENVTSTAYEIYKAKPYLKKIDDYQIVSNQVLFTDTVQAGDVYVVAAPSKINRPVFYYKKQFINLRSLAAQADYIAITHPKFLQSVNNYVNEISSIYGVSKDLISVEDIFDEFGFGYPTPESIRLFTAVTYQNRIEPKPQYLNLIGDADYDYKLYRFKADGVKGGGNYVPGFGNPISDNWLVVWDEAGLPIPQMKVGRIPINKPEELDYYLSKIENNFNSRYDAWNKSFLFFSGGRANEGNEIDQLKAVNDQVINSFVKNPPLAGNYNHFYKTKDPLSDFGPHTPEEISTVIENGGVFISYVGHSGTATWDNSISETTQLMNKINRNPLISDFGCSTNKFAEPDIICFGERFILNNNGQAIGYVGNSSLGFTSTSFTVPTFFYESLLTNQNNEVGQAHLDSKIKMFQNLGSSSVFRLFSLTNMLIGDPVVQIKIPRLPNLQINPADIVVKNSFLNDQIDSAQIELTLNNLGIVISDSLNYTIEHLVNGIGIDTVQGRVGLPNFQDKILFAVATKNLPGQHTLNISIDQANEIEEIYEDDNYLSYNFNVFSTELRDLVKHQFENSSLSKIDILNPTMLDSAKFNIVLQISETEDFQVFQQYKIIADSFFTTIPFNQLIPGRRYFFRYKLDETGAVFSNIKSFENRQGSTFYLSDSTSFKYQNLSDINFVNNSLSIIPKQDQIAVTSAGWYAGATCIIAKNGINLLSNTFFAGMGIVVFDDITLEVDTSTWYNLFNEPANMQRLVNLIDSIPQGKIVAMGVADDAANNISAALKNAIKTLGSTKIDGLQFRGSWALIGKKGAVPGEVKEVIHAPFDGLIFIDSTFTIPKLNGDLETIDLGPASKWNSIQVSEDLPSNTFINHKVLGIKLDGAIDSLGTLILNNGVGDLGFINAQVYPKIKIRSDFIASPEGLSPKMNSLNVDYTGLAELGTNFQVVSLSADTVLIGDQINLNFYIYNIGDISADSFFVNVDLINENNTRNNLFNQQVNSLNAGERKYFEVSYQTKEGDRFKSFTIAIDNENRVTEYYKDNNFFTKQFFVKPDLAAPQLKITFDGTEVVDGDFVSDKPIINISLSDESPVPFTDTSSVKIFLNEEPVYFAANSSILSYQINSSNPKFVAEYKPQLSDGEYLLRVAAKDVGGNLADSSSSQVSFVVSSETKLLQVYNYPNPFSNETYFTFRLTQIPEEIKIKIFTIAGRLIKDILIPSSQLKYDFNKIYWDGRDEDGDQIANGTYLYKVILRSAEKTESSTQKLVIVR